MVEVRREDTWENIQFAGGRQWCDKQPVWEWRLGCGIALGRVSRLFCGIDDD